MNGVKEEQEKLVRVVPAHSPSPSLALLTLDSLPPSSSSFSSWCCPASISPCSELHRDPGLLVLTFDP